MLLRSLNHVAQATGDLDATLTFHEQIFDATVDRMDGGHAFIRVGHTTALHVFERSLAGDVDTAPWRHGPLDHLAFEARDLDAFMTARRRLLARGLAAEQVTDLGPLVSVHFRDPDGLTQELSLWKTPGFDPPFPTTPFRGKPGRGGAS